MADVNIKGQVSIDTSAAEGSMNKLNATIKDAKKALADAKVGSNEYKAAQLELKAAQKELQTATELANSTHNKSGEAFSLLKGKVQGLVPGLSGAESGVKSLGSQLKILAMNPVMLILTAIVAVLAFLYESFTSSVEGGKKMQQVFAGLQAVASQVKDALFALGRSLIDVVTAAYQFMHLDFAGAAESMKAAGHEGTTAMKELGHAVTDTMGKFMDLEAQQQALNKAKKIAAVEDKHSQTLLLKSREIIMDETASIKDKKVALESVTAADTKSSAERVKNAAEDLRLGQERQKAAGIETEAGKKMNQELRDLDSANEDAKQEGIIIGTRLIKQRKLLERQEAAEDKGISDAAAAVTEKATAKAKAAQAENSAYRLRIHKQEKEIDLAQTFDAHQKELAQLRNKIEDEKYMNKKAMEDGKLSKAHYNQLAANIDKLAALERNVIEEKYNKERKEKEKNFAAEVNKIRLDIQLAGVTDVVKKEKILLKIAYDDKAKAAQKEYKDNAAMLYVVMLATNADYQAKLKAINKKATDEELKASQSLALRKIAFEFSQAKADLATKKKLLSQKMDIINAQYAAEILAAQGNAAKLQEIEFNHTVALAAASEANKEIKKEEVNVQKENAIAVGSIMLGLSDLVGKQTATGKALAISSSLINTYSAITATLAAAAKTPAGGIPGYAIAQSISTGIAGFAAVANIAKVQVPGGGGGSSMPTVSKVSAPLAPLPEHMSTSLSQSSINGIGNAAQGGTNRTFVLDSDIKNSAERMARINRAARLG